MNETVNTLFEKVKTTAKTAGRVTGQALDQAGKKAGEQLEIVKLNLQISDCEKTIETKLQTIGRLVFDAHLDPNTDTEYVDSILADVDELYAEIRDITVRIADLKQVCICPQCNKTLSKEDKYCRHCGKEL